MGKVKSKFPSWIKFKIPGGINYTRVKKAVQSRGLNTVCMEAGCPNIGECFACGTATFLIMGKVCTRNCKYCSIEQGKPWELDAKEPEKIARAIQEIGLSYAVITSVTRDDLALRGAEHFTETVRQIKKYNPDCKIEILIPDFKSNSEQALELLIQENPFVINHNIEVVKGLYSELRPMGDYSLSLYILEKVSASHVRSKSGLMIGFGESIDDIKDTIKDLAQTGCSSLTVGQYLQSSKKGYPVKKFYHPLEFKEIKEYAIGLGFVNVQSDPLVRSSYHAADIVISKDKV